MNLRPGEVIPIRIGFHQASGGKLRPAVVLLDSGDDDFVAAPITSRFRLSKFDLVIQEWNEAGLNTAPTIRVHKLTVLTKNEVMRRLGELTAVDRSRLAGVFRDAFSLDQEAPDAAGN